MLSSFVEETPRIRTGVFLQTDKNDCRKYLYIYMLDYYSLLMLKHFTPAIDIHARITDERVMKKLDDQRGMFKRPALHLQKTLLMGFIVEERLKEQRNAFLKGESMLPPIDLYGDHGLFEMSLEEQIKHRLITRAQLFRIYKSYLRLHDEFQRPLLQDMIHDF